MSRKAVSVKEKSSLIKEFDKTNLNHFVVSKTINVSTLSIQKRSDFVSAYDSTDQKQRAAKYVYKKNKQIYCKFPDLPLKLGHMIGHRIIYEKYCGESNPINLLYNIRLEKSNPFPHLWLWPLRNLYCGEI